jgi:hypothetical protein
VVKDSEGGAVSKGNRETGTLPPQGHAQWSREAEQGGGSGTTESYSEGQGQSRGEESEEE